MRAFFAAPARCARHRGLADKTRRTWRAILRDARVPGAFRSRHRQLVLARMRALSLVLAVLTLAWIPVDVVVLGSSYAGLAAPLRIVLALTLWAWPRAAQRLPLGFAVNGFAWLQAIGFAALQMQVGAEQAGALQLGYGLFPFVLAAQLALLALPWPRTLLAGLAPGAQLLFMLVAQLPAVGAIWSDVWLFGLILLLATWTGDAQRRLLVELLDARHDATHDALTGLANRRSAEERLEAWRADAVRHHEPLSVLALDLDHFKQVNDRHGHAAGDLVLQAVGRVLREQLRGGDLGARHGGEEFLVVLPHCARGEAIETAERLRQRIAATRVPLDGDALRVTVSIGVASLAGDESLPALLARADAALYAAKARGRDRCVVAPARTRTGLPFDPTPPSPVPAVPEFR